MRSTPLGRLLLPSLLAFLPLGCDAPNGATAAPEKTVYDSAGVRIVHFPASALDVRAPRQLAPEPAVRIGVVEGPAGVPVDPPHGCGAPG